MSSRLIALAAAAGVLLSAAVALAQTPAQAVHQACAADAKRLCPGVQPGGGRIAECMKAQENQVSVGCARALMAAKEARQQGQGAPPPPGH